MIPFGDGYLDMTDNLEFSPCVLKYYPSGDLSNSKWGSKGIGDGQFDNPCGIALDAKGYFYIADTGNNRIQVFDPNGQFVTKWGTRGSDDGQFKEPSGVSVDNEGNVYVVDSGNNRIQKFAPILNLNRKNKGDGIVLSE